VGQEGSGFSILFSTERMIEIPVIPASTVPARPCPLLFRGFPFRNDLVILRVLIIRELCMCSDWFLPEELLFNEVGVSFCFVGLGYLADRR